jgi:cell division protein FtsZ
MIDYKIFTFGNVGEYIANSLLRRDISNEHVFYFNTAQDTVENAFLENKYCIGNLPRFYPCFGSDYKETANKVFEEEDKLFDNLTDNDSLYIIVGSFAGTISGGFIPKMAEFLKRKGKRFIAIGMMPFKFENSLKQNQSICAMADLQKITSNLIILPNENVRQLFENLSIKDAFDNSIYYVTEVIMELLFSHKETDKIMSVLLQKDTVVAESIIKMKKTILFCPVLDD